MNDDLIPHVDRLVELVGSCVGHDRIELLIRESMALAYATGTRDGVREVQAIMHTQGAIRQMREGA